MTEVMGYFYTCRSGGSSKYYLIHGSGDGSGGSEVYYGRISALRWGFSNHFHYDMCPDSVLAKKKRSWARKGGEYILVFDGINSVPVHKARARKWGLTGSHSVTPAEVEDLGCSVAFFNPADGYGDEEECVGAGVVAKGWFNNGR